MVIYFCGGGCLLSAVTCGRIVSRLPRSGPLPYLTCAWIIAINLEMLLLSKKNKTKQLHNIIFIALLDKEIDLHACLNARQQA